MPFKVIDTCGPPVPILSLLLDDDGRHYLRLPRIVAELDDAASCQAFFAGKASVGMWSDMTRFLFVVESDASGMVLQRDDGVRLRVEVSMKCPPGRVCE